MINPFSKSGLLCALTIGCGHPPEGQELDVVQSEAVYWVDDRKDRYEISDSVVLAAFSRTALLTDPTDLQANANGTFTLKREANSAGTHFNLCGGERYFQQPVVQGFGTPTVQNIVSHTACTAVLVAPDLIATSNSSSCHCSFKRVVFGYHQILSGVTNVTFGAQDVYVVDQSPVAEDLGDGGWRLCRLTTPVVGRTPAPIRRTGAVSWQQQVFSIGHGLGMPMKYKNNAVGDTSKAKYFESELDVFSGDQGSPVFSTTGVLEGILTQTGGVDFQDHWDCHQYRYCGLRAVTCDQPDVTRATQFQQHVP